MSELQLHEVILYVEDMDKQLRFYRDVIGLKVTFPSDLALINEVHWVTFQTGACSLALHSGGENAFGNDSPRFVFKVDDIEKRCRELIGKNVIVGQVRSPARNIHVLDVTDPEGNRFSFESVDHSKETSLSP